MPIIHSFLKLNVSTPPGDNILLEDFATARLNGDGGLLWHPYLGEDPNQTGGITGGQFEIATGVGNGAYLYCFPRDGGYPFPEGYSQTFIKTGVWDIDINRLTFWVKCDTNITRDPSGSDNLQIGTYIRDHAEVDPAFQGAHYYHLLSPNWYANKWIYMELNRVPQHQVGQDANTNWPENPEAPVVNYYDGLTLFYFDTQGNEFFNTNWVFDDWYFGKVANEPDQLVSSIAATYSGSRYEVTWAGPKNTGQDYDVRYRSTTMKVDGFTSGTDGGTVSNPGSAYTGTFWQSPIMGELADIYIAIRPDGSTDFTEIHLPQRA